MMAGAFVAALACSIAPVASHAQNAYITNSGSNTVSVINTATSSLVGSPIAVGKLPYGLAVNPSGRRVYVGNHLSNTVSVIDTTTNAWSCGRRLDRRLCFKNDRSISAASRPCGTQGE